MVDLMDHFSWVCDVRLVIHHLSDWRRIEDFWRDCCDVIWDQRFFDCFSNPAIYLEGYYKPSHWVQNMSPLQATMSLVRSDGRRSPGCLNLVLLRDLFIYFSTKRSPVSTQRQCGVMVEVHFQKKKVKSSVNRLKQRKIFLCWFTF